MSKKFEIKLYETERGFIRGNFDDLYGSHCSVQESSLATEAAIWLGVHEESPNYREQFSSRISSRMHLNQKQVMELIPLLQFFADTGELPRREG